MPVGVAVGVGVRVAVAVRVRVCVAVNVGTRVLVGVGVGVDEGVAVAVAEAVAVGNDVRVGVAVPFGVRVMVGDGLGVGVHGAAKVAKMSARIGMKSRAESPRSRNRSASTHVGNFEASPETTIAALKSAAVPRPSQLASAISGSGVGVDVGVRVGVGGAVGVGVRVGVGVSVGACTGVLCATAAPLQSRATHSRAPARAAERRIDRVLSTAAFDWAARLTACTRTEPILGHCVETGRQRIRRDPR